MQTRLVPRLLMPWLFRTSAAMLWSMQDKLDLLNHWEGFQLPATSVVRTEPICFKYVPDGSIADMWESCIFSTEHLPRCPNSTTQYGIMVPWWLNENRWAKLKYLCLFIFYLFIFQSGSRRGYWARNAKLWGSKNGKSILRHRLCLESHRYWNIVCMVDVNPCVRHPIVPG